MNKQEVVRRLVSRCPGFDATWSEHGVHWHGEPAGEYNDLGVLASWLVSQMATKTFDCFAELFREVEMLLAGADAETRDLLVVGFLEDIQNIATNRKINPDLALPYLGPESRKGWFELIRLWHGPAGEGWPGRRSEGLDYLRDRATADVRATVDWLLANGFQVEREWGGPDESFGDVQVRFRAANIAVAVTRDRSQWVLEIQQDGWDSGGDLGLVLDAMSDVDSWSPASIDQPLAEQLPAGAQWIEQVPRALEWLATAPDVNQTLQALRRERARQRFPEWEKVPADTIPPRHKRTPHGRLKAEPRAVLVDVGGTLWSELSLPRDANGHAARAEYSVLNPAERHRAVWERRLAAIDVPEEQIAELCTQLNRALLPAVTSEHFDVWSAIGDAARVAGVVGVEADRIRSACCLPAQDFTTLLPGAESLLAAFKHRGARVVIASNAIWRGEDDYWSDFRSFGIDGLIDSVVSSVDVCWRKPSDRFYDAVLERAGFAPGDCLMIGNSETLDVAPSKARGMSAIRVAIEEPHPLSSSADLVCDSLGEVLAATLESWLN